MIPGNKDTRDGILFSLPFLVIFALFMVYPLLFGLYISFFKWNILSTPQFCGMQNYIGLFHDQKFYTSLWHTVEFVLITTPVLLVMGFAMALAVTGKSPLRDLMETVFFLPYIFSMTVVATLWAWLMQKDFGIFNQVIVSLGGSRVSWLTNDKWAIWSVCIATFWWTAGFNMVLFTAGIKQIPKEVYESAQIDGANYWQCLNHITIPLVSHTTILCLILQVIASFNVFGQVYVMTGGGPAGSTRVLVQYIYENGFQYFKMGYSAAMSYILFIIVLLVSVLQYVLLGRKKEE
jgi:multiple sugar transport system permease protein